RNTRDHTEAIASATKYFEDAQKDPKLKADLEYRALKGQPPPSPTPPTDKGFPVELKGYKGPFKYKWVELGRQERHTMHLSNDEEKKEGNTRWRQIADAREKGLPYRMPDGTGQSETLLWSRAVSNPSRLPLKDRDKKYEYFFLTRDPETDQEITGQFLTSAGESTDPKTGGIAVGFHLTSRGASRSTTLRPRKLREGKPKKR